MNRIKQLRNEKNINQDVLAKLLGLEIAGVSKLETERVPLKDEYIIKLSDYFNVSSDYLLGLSDIRNIEQDNTSEIRAIARDVAKLKPEKKELFKNLLKQMSDEADEASKK